MHLYMLSQKDPFEVSQGSPKFILEPLILFLKSILKKVRFMARSGNSSGALLSKTESLKLLDIIFNTQLIQKNILSFQKAIS